MGIFGQIAEQLEYKAYVMNGFDATGFGADGLRGGRQKGSEALAEHLVFVGRLDWTPMPELLVGGSVYVGNSGQDQDIVVDGIAGDSTASAVCSPYASRKVVCPNALTNSG